MLDLDLHGKTAVVSGSTAGIGFSTALALAGLGARVVVTGRTAARVDEAVRKLDSESSAKNAIGVHGDLTSAEGAAGLLRAVPHADIVVNNLGIFEPKAFDEITDAEWLRFFEANVLSGVRLARAYLGGMRA